MKRALALIVMLASSASSAAAAVMALMKQGKTETEIVAEPEPVDPIMKKEMNVKVYKASDCKGHTFNVVNIRPNGTAKVKDFEGTINGVGPNKACCIETANARITGTYKVNGVEKDLLLETDGKHDIEGTSCGANYKLTWAPIE
jgi:FlaG/FlaF family flagellin (archaellin)